MFFKGINLNSGDIVIIQAKSLDFPNITVAVSSVFNNTLSAVGEYLKPSFGHKGEFTEKDVTEIKVLKKYHTAISEGSSGKFSKYQRVTGSDGNQTVTGMLLGIIDGLAIIELDDLSICTTNLNTLQSAS
jgi:hypothetical protein